MFLVSSISKVFWCFSSDFPGVSSDSLGFLVGFPDISPVFLRFNGGFSGDLPGDFRLRSPRLRPGRGVACDAGGRQGRSGRDLQGDQQGERGEEWVKGGLDSGGRVDRKP